MLVKFQNIVVLTEEEVGLIHLVQHNINTGDARPIKTYPGLPFALQAVADNAIEEMVRAGIIKPSDSPWASVANQHQIEPEKRVLY